MTGTALKSVELDRTSANQDVGCERCEDGAVVYLSSSDQAQRCSDQLNPSDSRFTCLIYYTPEVEKKPAWICLLLQDSCVIVSDS